jgi:hypothetical protein
MALRAVRSAPQTTRRTSAGVVSLAAATKSEERGGNLVALIGDASSQVDKGVFPFEDKAQVPRVPSLHFCLHRASPSLQPQRNTYGQES